MQWLHKAWRSLATHQAQPDFTNKMECSIFLSKLLLFVVKPTAAKQLLHILGGSSAVWLACLVFFQTTLLLS